MFADLLIKSGHHWQKFHLKYRPKKTATLKTENQKKKRKKRKRVQQNQRCSYMRVYLKMYLICTHETWHELKEEKKKITRKNMPLVLNRR